MGMLVVFLAAYGRTWRRIVQASVVPAHDVHEMLVEAAIACRLRRAPRLLLSQAVASPAVTGLFRPTLLLPAGFPSDLSEEEAQLVVRHELIHLKRGDLPVNWLLCLIQALHWCNPIVWLAVHRIRADRESACDAQVLESSRTDAREVYGHALLKMEGTLASAGWTLGFVGIFEREADIRTRILAIAGYRHTNIAGRSLAAVVLAVLTLAGATRAQERAAAAGPPEGAPGEVVLALGSDPSAGEEAAKNKIHRTLGSIIIPRIEFREATVRDALLFLERKSVELDRSEPEQSKRGVKIVLKLEQPKAPEPVREEAQTKPEEARLTISLVNIPLGEALRYVTGLANLKFRVKPDGVEIVPLSAPDPLITKEWIVGPGLGFNPGDDAQALLLADGITFPEGAAASLSADGSRLTVRNTQENLERIDNGLENRPEPAEPSHVSIRRKLMTIVIPRLEFRNATLREALEFLKKKSVEFDPAEDPANRGVSIVWKSTNAPAVSLALSFSSIPGLEAVPAPPVPQPNKEEPRLTLSLSNIPLGEALRYVAGLTNHRVSVEQYAVALIEKGEPSADVTAKEWKLDETMARALALGQREASPELRQHGVTFPEGSAAIWLRTSRKLIMRNTRENHDRVDQLLASLAGEPTLAGEPGGSAEQKRAEALVIPTLTFREATLREAVDFIKAKSAAVDPEKKGVNVVLDVPAKVQETKLTLSLTNASIWDALRQIARMAEVELTGEAHAVRIHAPTSPSSKE
jgi:hypothetical protein